MSVNKAIILGNLGQDPELKTLPTGQMVCNFSVATTDKWKDKSGSLKEKTEWHKINVWGKQAESCNQYLSKGRSVYVEGKIETRSWEDKEGKKRYTTEIKATTVQFIGGQAEKNEALKSTATATPDYKVSTDSNFASDSIPF